MSDNIADDLSEWIIWLRENADDDGLCRVNQEELLKTLRIASQAIDEKRSTVDDLDESTHLRWENLRQVDIDNIVSELPFATLRFYANDPDSMRRFRLCLQAEEMHNLLFELSHNTIHDEMEYRCADNHDGEVAYNTLQWVQDQIWAEIEARDIRMEE